MENLPHDKSGMKSKNPPLQTVQYSSKNAWITHWILFDSKRILIPNPTEILDGNPTAKEGMDYDRFRTDVRKSGFRSLGGSDSR
ncbi:hypothetical protein J6590_031897 [Homalodisca vitripennis]|nr:hypothetical protein J6590_031897 [Homalodisca vitripennis]